MLHRRGALAWLLVLIVCCDSLVVQHVQTSNALSAIKDRADTKKAITASESVIRAFSFTEKYLTTHQDIVDDLVACARPDLLPHHTTPHNASCAHITLSYLGDFASALAAQDLLGVRHEGVAAVHGSRPLAPMPFSSEGDRSVFMAGTDIKSAQTVILGSALLAVAAVVSGVLVGRPGKPLQTEAEPETMLRKFGSFVYFWRAMTHVTPKEKHQWLAALCLMAQDYEPLSAEELADMPPLEDNDREVINAVASQIRMEDSVAQSHVTEEVAQLSAVRDTDGALQMPRDHPSVEPHRVDQSTVDAFLDDPESLGSPSGGNNGEDSEELSEGLGVLDSADPLHPEEDTVKQNPADVPGKVGVDVSSMNATVNTLDDVLEPTSEEAVPLSLLELQQPQEVVPATQANTAAPQTALPRSPAEQRARQCWDGLQEQVLQIRDLRSWRAMVKRSFKLLCLFFLGITAISLFFGLYALLFSETCSETDLAQAHLGQRYCKASGDVRTCEVECGLQPGQYGHYICFVTSHVVWAEKRAEWLPLVPCPSN